MKSKIAVAALVALLASVGAAQAGGITRNTTIYGPAGVTTHQAQRYCFDGVCTYAGSTVGPYGYSASRSATTTQIDDGVYQRSVSGVGPRGNSWSRSGTLTVNR